MYANLATRVKLNLDINDEADRQANWDVVLTYYDNITRKSIFKAMAKDDFSEREPSSLIRKSKKPKTTDPRVLELVLLTSEIPPKGPKKTQAEEDEGEFVGFRPTPMELKAQKAREAKKAAEKEAGMATPKPARVTHGTPSRVLQPTSGNKRKRTLPWDRDDPKYKENQENEAEDGDGDGDVDE